MGSTLTRAKTVFRDFLIDGAPASGPFDPPKPDVIDVFKTADDRLTALEGSTFLSSLTLTPVAALDDLDTIIAHITSDGTFRLIQVGWLRENLMEKWYPFDASAVVTTEARLLIPADATRNSLSIYNAGAADVMVGLGGRPRLNAPTTIVIPPGKALADVHGRQDAVWAQSTSGNVALTATYTNTSNVDVVATALANAFFAKLSGAQVTADKTAITNLIIALRQSGAWQRMNSARLYAQTDAVSGLVDLIRLTSASGVNSPGFTAYHGVAGNGSNSYVDTGYSSLADATKFGLTDHSFGTYIFDTVNAVSNSFHLGYSACAIMGNRAGNTAVYRSGSLTSDVLTWAGKQGLYAVSRDNPATYKAFWRNNAQTVTRSADTLGATGNTFFASALSGSSGASGFSTNTIAFDFMGSSMTDDQMASVQTAVKAYMVAIGAETA